MLSALKVYQSGVALLMALLVVALASLAAVAILSRQNLDIRRTATILDTDQAYLYASGAEDWARQILNRDGAQTRSDHLGEIWALRLPPTPVDGGHISGHLEDLQGRFNLNNLIDSQGQVQETELQILIRLLALLDLPRSFSSVLLDWMDSDDNPRLDGAEDSYYLRQEVMYRSANQPLAHPSEIRALMGMNATLYQRLLPYVTALPQRTAININTTSAPLLAAVLNLSLLHAETLIVDRPAKGYDSVDTFLREANITAPPDTIDTTLLSVNSGYFLLRAKADIGISQARLYSVLHRQANKTTLLWRSRSAL
jgi:general secretion pathway protein K